MNPLAINPAISSRVQRTHFSSAKRLTLPKRWTVPGPDGKEMQLSFPQCLGNTVEVRRGSAEEVLKSPGIAQLREAGISVQVTIMYGEKGHVKTSGGSYVVDAVTGNVAFQGGILHMPNSQMRSDVLQFCFPASDAEQITALWQ